MAHGFLISYGCKLPPSLKKSHKWGGSPGVGCVQKGTFLSERAPQEAESSAADFEGEVHLPEDTSLSANMPIPLQPG